MTTPEHVLRFIADVEEYYGKYPPKIRLGVLSVLHHDGGGWYSADFLDRLYDALTDNFSHKWGKVPGKIELREAMESMPPAPPAQAIAHGNAPQITDDAGAIPAEYGQQYITDIWQAFKAGKIRPDGPPAVFEDGTVDDRPTAHEYEQRWREKRGIA